MKKSGDIHLPPHEYVNLTGQVGSRDSPPPGIHREGGGGQTGKWRLSLFLYPVMGTCSDLFVCVSECLLSQMGNPSIHL